LENAMLAKEQREAPVPDPSEVKIWETKGIHFWTVFGAILVKARPESILEFGGGRSTTLLADYASRARIRSVTIEQSEVWYRKIVSDLQFMSVRGTHVHHVPLTRPDADVPWYDFEAAQRLLGERAFDLVFVDGPVGESRRNRRGQALVAKAARDARLIVVDDLHRPYNLAYFNELTARFPAHGRLFHRYPVGQNVIGIGAGEWAGLVRSCFEFLEIPFSTELTEGNKAEGRKGE
jgi:predicted O-methyltransferase YrrM